jgi:N4-gp56 family major capsid protein
MAYTTFGVNDANAVKLWSKQLSIAARDTLEIAPLIGDDENSIIQMRPETKKGPGDNVKFSLLTRLTGDGFSENETALGNAESMTVYYDSVTINEIGNVVAPPSDNVIDAQRVPWNLRERGKELLGLWFADRMATWFFNQVCGYTAETRAKYYGYNAPTAPTTSRKIFAGTATTDQGLTSSDKMTLDLIDKAKENAVIGSNKIRAVRIGGRDKYVFYMHPYQWTDLKTNTSTGQWFDIQKAALQGGAGTNSPLYTGAMGEYNDVILRVSQDVTQGAHSSTSAAQTSVRRAVLLGAQSAAIAFGQNNGPTRYRWTEELDDHGRKLEIGGWTIAGMKKTVFNSVDFGALTVSTYAAAH